MKQALTTFVFAVSLSLCGLFELKADPPTLLERLLGGGQKETSEPPTPATSAPSKAITERREAEVHFVYFRNSDPPIGGTSPCLMIVEPNSRRRPSVGVTQQFSSGTGQQFIGAAWMAALNACSVLEMDISDARFSLDLGGIVDGPSAGMLMTATFTALLNGDTVRSDSTMTGAVNQDGTAGPVGGIPQKMEGAVAAGFKRFGFPIGTRMSTDLKTDQLVDVVTYGEALGLEVVEIRDLWDAYEFLTGKPLSRPNAVDESEMELDAAVRVELTQDIDSWANRSGQLARKIEQEFGSFEAEGILAIADGTRESLAQAQLLYEEGENFLNGGMVAAAWRRHIEAAALMATVEAQLEIMRPLAKGDIETMITLLNQRAQVEEELEKVFQRFSDQALGQSLDGTIAAISGLSNCVQAYGFTQEAETARETAQKIVDGMKEGKLDIQEPEVQKALTSNMIQPHLWYAISAMQLEMAQRNLVITNEAGSQKQADSDALDRLASGYASAAYAANDYFKALVIEGYFGNDAPSQVEDDMMRKEGDYWSILRAMDRATTLQHDASKTTSEDSLLSLGAGVYAYQRLSALSNKYYCLQPEFDDKGEIRSFRSPSALRHQLSQAERRCREVAGRCKESLGFIPESARLSYQIGSAFREGSAADKVVALDNFGKCIFWCNFALVVAK